MCEPKPEHQRDWKRGYKREECCLGLIRALLSGLRFLSIRERVGQREGDGGYGLSSREHLGVLSPPPVGLFYSPNFKVLYL